MNFVFLYNTFTVLIFSLQKQINDNNILFLIDAFKYVAHCVHKYKYIFNFFKKNAAPQILMLRL